MNTDKKVALVVPQRVARLALSSLLSREGFLVESFSSTAEFFRNIHPSECGCLILDIDLMGGSGTDWKLVERASRWNTRLPVVALSSDPSQLPFRLPFETVSKEAGNLPLLYLLSGGLDGSAALQR